MDGILYPLRLGGRDELAEFFKAENRYSLERLDDVKQQLADAQKTIGECGFQRITVGR